MATAKVNIDALRKQIYEQGRVIIDDAIAQAVATEEKRIDELEELARSMIGAFVFTSDGYRARAGQVQIAKWTATLNGQP